MVKNKSLKRFFLSFKYAFQGIKYAYLNEQNILVMSFLGIVAIILGIVLRVSNIELIIILLLDGIILGLELINTSIEAVVDLHDGDNKSKYGKIAKDCASGGLLVLSIFALIIGILIFIPRIINLF